MCEVIGKVFVVMAVDKDTHATWPMCASMDRETALEEIENLSTGQGSKFLTYYLETTNLVANIGRHR